MKCPFCGAEMEHGTLHSRGGNYFLPDEEKVRFYTQKSLEKARAIPLPPNPYGKVGEAPAWPEAYCCRACRMLILPYNEEPL